MSTIIQVIAEPNYQVYTSYLACRTLLFVMTMDEGASSVVARSAS